MSFTSDAPEHQAYKDRIDKAIADVEIKLDLFNKYECNPVVLFKQMVNVYNICKYLENPDINTETLFKVIRKQFGFAIGDKAKHQHDRVEVLFRYKFRENPDEVKWEYDILD